MNSDAHIARKIIVLISALIKKISSSKNVIFTKNITRHSILNVLKN